MQRLTVMRGWWLELSRVVIDTITSLFGIFLETDRLRCPVALTTELMKLVFSFVPVKPEFACENTTAVVGQPLNFTCRISSNPPQNYWTVAFPRGQSADDTTDTVVELTIIELEVCTILSVLSLITRVILVSYIVEHFVYIVISCHCLSKPSVVRPDCCKWFGGLIWIWLICQLILAIIHEQYWTAGFMIVVVQPPPMLGNLMMVVCSV